jgi:hypothetical protein
MLLGAANVTHLVTPSPFSHPGLREIPVAAVGTDTPLRVFRNPLALPRARVVTDLHPWTSARDVAATIESAAENFFAKSAFVEAAEIDRIRSVASSPARAPGDGSQSGVSLLSDTGHRVTLRTSGSGGFLVLSDCLTPGWNATVDGRPVPVFFGDIAFRLVPVPAGNHEVVFEYNPWRSGPAR